MKYEEVLKELHSKSDPSATEKMKRFGIEVNRSLGISVPKLRNLASEVGTDHSLALKLWDSGVHEARILASMVDDPRTVTEEQMEKWVRDFDSWDVCDGCCGNLFDKTKFAFQKALEWSSRDEEYVRRAGFALMAELAVHDKNSKDKLFINFLPSIKRGSTDERNFVKKAVNWALRQIGKKNPRLNKEAIKAAREISKIDSKSAKWVASDAVRELTDERVQNRLRTAAGK